MMDDMEKIRYLVERCQGGFSIEWNQHRSNYWPPHEEVDSRDYDVPLDVQREMDAKDTMVAVQGYPDTPIGFYVVAHWDLTAALDELVAAIGERDMDL